jgi:hypothetical protein
LSDPSVGTEPVFTRLRDTVLARRSFSPTDWSMLPLSEARRNDELMTTPCCWKMPPESEYRVVLTPEPPPVTPSCRLLIGAVRKICDCQSVF